jgi:flavin-dependent dehydrogenase
MSEQFDVIIVGARCAGSPLATLLARQGVRVAVLEQAVFPRDTISTHIFQAPVLAMFDRLGVVDKVKATGAPLVNHLDFRLEGLTHTGAFPRLPTDLGATASVRRFRLDPILADAAADAGADMRMGCKVTGLIEDAGRVVGVNVRSNGNEQTLKASLVVGADGRNSTVAALVGARKYNVTPSDRAAFWAFFEGANLSSEPIFTFHRWDTKGVLGVQADSGLYQVGVLPELCELPGFRADLEGSFMRYARSCPPVAAALDGARRAGKTFGIVRWEGFFRDASGPGWVLVGDSGNFKDPTPGQGISDALRQVDALVPTILGALDGGPARMDDALRTWGQWRDVDGAEHYWFATDLGKGGTVQAVVPEMLSRTIARGTFDEFIDLFMHRTRPSRVLSPARLVGATARLMARRGTHRRTVLREVGDIIAEDLRRRRMKRNPAYVAGAADAGATEVD